MVKTNKLPAAVLKSLSSVLTAKDAREFAKEIVPQKSSGDKFVKGMPKLSNPAATAGTVQRSILARGSQPTVKRSLAKEMAEVYDRLPASLRPKFLAKLTNKALTPKMLKGLSASGNEVVG